MDDLKVTALRKQLVATIRFVHADLCGIAEALQHKATLAPTSADAAAYKLAERSRERLNAWLLAAAGDGEKAPLIALLDRTASGRPSPALAVEAST